MTQVPVLGATSPDHEPQGGTGRNPGRAKLAKVFLREFATGPTKHHWLRNKQPPRPTLACDRHPGPGQSPKTGGMTGLPEEDRLASSARPWKPRGMTEIRRSPRPAGDRSPRRSIPVGLFPSGSRIPATKKRPSRRTVKRLRRESSHSKGEQRAGGGSCRSRSTGSPDVSRAKPGAT